jgi:hypothetical protein
MNTAHPSVDDLLSQMRCQHQPVVNIRRTLSLEPAALDLLAAMKPKHATGPLFPGANGSSRVTLRGPWVQPCKAAGLAEAITLKGRRRTITRYRPTVRMALCGHQSWSTILQTLSADIFLSAVVGSIVGLMGGIVRTHAVRPSRGLSATYSHSYSLVFGIAGLLHPLAFLLILLLIPTIEAVAASLPVVANIV